MMLIEEVNVEDDLGEFMVLPCGATGSSLSCGVAGSSGVDIECP
jgi:hypothetical protein